MSFLKYIFSRKRPWYFKATGIVACFGFLAMAVIFCACYREQFPQGKHSAENAQLSVSCTKYVDLCTLSFVSEYLPKCVLMPALLVGYTGYSLDLLYKRFR